MSYFFGGKRREPLSISLIKKEMRRRKETETEEGDRQTNEKERTDCQTYKMDG